MDPLSVTASVLAVATFAVKSCEGIYETLSRIAEAPKELEQHLTAVQNLRATLEDIAKLQDEGLPDGILTPTLVGRLRACMLDLKTIDELARSFHDTLKEGKRSRALARVRLSLGDQKRALKNHLGRIEAHHRTLSLDLLLLNTRLGLRFQPRPDCTSTLCSEQCILPRYVASERLLETASHDSIVQGNHHSASQAISLRSSTWKRIDKSLFRCQTWAGSITRPITPSSDLASSRYNLQSKQGYGVALATVLEYLCPYRIELAIYLLTHWTGVSVNLSLNWNISLPRIIPYDSRIADMSLRGDVVEMREEFATGRAGVFDVLPNGTTLLHLAASKGHEDAVRYLLENGSRVNAMDDFGDTPLHTTLTLSQSTTLTSLLLSYGADLLNCNTSGQTPLHTFPTPLTLHILLSHMSDLDLAKKDRRGRTVLHWLAWSSKTTVESFQKVLDKSGVGINAADAEGKTALHYAAQRGNLALLKYLGSHPSNSQPDIIGKYKDKYGRTPFHYAVESKRAAAALTLLWNTYNANPSIDMWRPDHEDRSVLHYAVEHKNLDAVKEILEFGVKVSISTGVDMVQQMLCGKDRYGNTPLSVAMFKFSRSSHMVLFLLQMVAQYKVIEIEGERRTQLKDNTPSEHLYSACTYTDRPKAFSLANLLSWIPTSHGGSVYCGLLTLLIVALGFWMFRSFYFSSASKNFPMARWVE